jgi:hypothetical protein
VIDDFSFISFEEALSLKDLLTWNNPALVPHERKLPYMEELAPVRYIWCSPNTHNKQRKGTWPIAGLLDCCSSLLYSQGLMFSQLSFYIQGNVDVPWNPSILKDSAG